MAHNKNDHPAVQLRLSSQHLREQTLFAQRQAANSAARTRQLSAELAALDLENVFRQLREMVAMVGGKSRRASNEVSGTADAIVMQAAE